MTIDEAIERLKGRYRTCSMFASVQEAKAENEAIDMAISALRAQQEAEKNEPFKWTFVKDHLPECEKGCEVGPVLFCTKHFVKVGYYGRGGKYRDSYFRIYTDAGEGIDSEYVIAWAWVSSLNPPKEAHNV